MELLFYIDIVRASTNNSRASNPNKELFMMMLLYCRESSSTKSYYNSKQANISQKNYPARCYKLHVTEKTACSFCVGPAFM